MKREGNVQNGTIENYEKAFAGYSTGKNSRREIQLFRENLEENLLFLLHSYLQCIWETSPYTEKQIYKPKPRVINKSPVKDHVIQWASMLPIEQWLFDTIYYRAPSCVPGKGTHYYVRQERDELREHSQEEVYYYVQLDVHHYFEHIDHELMKLRLRDKIKDPILLHFLDEFIDSFRDGLVLGVKLSQLLSGLYLAPFDRLAIRCFDLLDDPVRFKYYQNKYVTHCFNTCRTLAQALELSKGVEYLNGKFESFVREGLLHYSRFADNIVIKHKDKAFLHIIVDICHQVLLDDFKLKLNKSWNVRPMWMGNDVCGYVFYHERVELRKRNKVALCKQVAKLKKKGYSNEEIRQKAASRIGFASHADTKNLLKKLEMEKRLGAVVGKRKRKTPFEGMTGSQKRSIDEIICKEKDDENEKIIRLLDYKIEDSIIESNEDGSPKQRIAIRYNRADKVDLDAGKEGAPVYTWSEQEFYSFSGSKVMIDQGENDFSKADLPIATVVKEFTNKIHKKFYKFT